MKTKLVLTGLLAVASLCTLNSQNSSENGNIAPIPLGNNNSGFGFRALQNNQTGGNNNSAVGWESLFSNQNGGGNCAHGAAALWNNTDGNYNVAVGDSTLYSNTTGVGNVASGYLSLFSNTTGDHNVAAGWQGLFNNTSGSYNIAGGEKALFNNTSGSYNVGFGYGSLQANTTGVRNIGIGIWSLYSNTSGNYNIGIGINSSVSNTTGWFNIGIGVEALSNNQTGTENSALGHGALGSTTGSCNVGVGSGALLGNISGSYNSGFGCGTDVGASSYTNATAIGYGAIVSASDKVRLGDDNVTICEIFSGAVYTGSDGRFKNSFSESDVKGLEFINKLRPVVYNLDTRKHTEYITKHMHDSIRQRYLKSDFTKSSSVRRSGFIAQEVEEAAIEVGYNFDGIHKPENETDNYSLAYSQFVVPLVKAVQQMDKQKKEQDQQIENLTKELDAQKVLVNELQRKSGINSGLTSLDSKTSEFSIDQNVPNPFSNETIINFSIPQEVKDAKLNVYDLTGKQLLTFRISERKSSSISLTATNLAAGIYLYTIFADGKVLEAKRMIVSEK